MRTCLYFVLRNPLLAIELLESLSKTPLIGDPEVDTEIYGVIEDGTGAQLFWGVGWSGGLGNEWAMIEWDKERLPSSRSIKNVFSVLDDTEINGTLDNEHKDRPHPYI